MSEGQRHCAVEEVSPVQPLQLLQDAAAALAGKGQGRGEVSNQRSVRCNAHASPALPAPGSQGDRPTVTVSPILQQLLQLLLESMSTMNFWRKPFQWL